MSYAEFAKELGLTTVIRSSRPASKSGKQKLLDVLTKEINYLKERNTLEIEMTEGGKPRISFWRKDNIDPSKALVAVKYKNKIFGFGSEVNRYKPDYLPCSYDVESVLALLEQIKNQLSKKDDNDSMFDSIK